MRLTTHKTDKAGVYTVKADGKDTGLTIEKSTPAKYGMVQEWDVMEANNDTYLFSAKGKATCLEILQGLSDLFIKLNG